MKTPLLAVLSPAKLLDDQTHYPQHKCSQPIFAEEAADLIYELRKLKLADISSMMSVSNPLAAQAGKQFQDWSLPFTHENAHPALLMFKGEVYRGLNATQFSREQLTFANTHLRILSGLYGVLRPMDFVMPYRLMMGTKFKGENFNNLYQYWTEKITHSISETLHNKGVLINLASSEYFKAIDQKKLGRTVITLEFQEKKGNQYVTVGTYAKLARGKMARFLIEEKIENPENLKAFSEDKYQYNKNLSDEKNFIFTRG
jgi:uncharacterized protein